jgi:hypothetical protein
MARADRVSDGCAHRRELIMNPANAMKPAIPATPVRRILLSVVLLVGAVAVYGFVWFPTTVQADNRDHGDGGGVSGTHPEGERIPNR